MLLVVTGVSNIFYLAYLLITLLEKIFPILISKFLNRALILFKFFTFFKHVLHSKPRRSTAVIFSSCIFLKVAVKEFIFQRSIIFIPHLTSSFFKPFFPELWSNMNLFFLFAGETTSV